jgi:hypothetical protein
LCRPGIPIRRGHDRFVFHTTTTIPGETTWLRPLALCARRRFNARPKGLFIMTLSLNVRGAILIAAALCGLADVTSPARADQCEDIAKQLANGIDGLKVNFKAANIIYLTHPAAKELSLGCRGQGQDYSNELYAKGDRRPAAQFYDLVASAAAIIFTLPKDDTTTGATRCLKRMGILRGDKVTMRYKRLNMECTRTKTEATIAITRPKDE